MHLSTPECEGVSSPRLADFVERFFDLEWTHGLVVMRHGRVIAECYRDLCTPDDRHQLFSLSKSFTSSAVGIALGEGLIPSLDAPLVSFFPEFLSPAVTERMRRVTLRNLLTMGMGRASCGFWGDRYGRLRDYLRDRLFRPLGIERDVAWDATPDGIDFGGTGLNLTVREIAAAAQLWLKGGVAPDGRRLIPASYMAEATAAQIPNTGPGRAPDWCQGYGYQFWRCRHGLFRGDGASGQLAVMLPAQDAVVAATAGVCNMQRELDAIWEELLPAFNDAPLPADSAGLARLRAVETSRRFDLGPAGAPSPALPLGEARRFLCAANPLGLVEIAAIQDDGGVALEFTFGDGLADVLRAGYAAPRASQLRRLAAGHAFRACARASWPSECVLEAKVAVPCSTSFFTLTLDFAASAFRSRTPIWFAHPWLCDVSVSLSGKQ